MRVLLFASAKDMVGAGELEVSLPPGSRLEDLLQLPTFKPLACGLSSLCFAVNEEFVGLKAPVKDGDVVAIMPPVSGG